MKPKILVLLLSAIAPMTHAQDFEPVLPITAVRSTPRLEATALAPSVGESALPSQAPEPAMEPAKPFAPTGAAPDATSTAATPNLIEPEPKPIQANLWARIRNGFTMPDLVSPLVERQQAWYVARPDYVLRMTERSSRYLYYIVEEIERRNMPMELALLPFVESAFNPQALSSAKAAGMWQFIPSTGKHFNLKQDLWRDERRSVTESTRAALDYFEKLYAQFGDWQLALASYNWGEGAVARAIQRNQRLGLPTDYASLKMPNETRFYVPKLQAIKNLIASSDALGLKLPVIPNQPFFATVVKTRDIDVATAARLADMPVDEFLDLNPSFNRPVILGATKPEILLPADKLETFQNNLQSWEGPLSSWTAYTVLPKDRLATIAASHGISETALREANRLSARAQVKAGSVLLVPRPKTMDQDISEQIIENAALITEGETRTRRLTHVVRKGESMASIARRYGASVEQIKGWNNLHSTAVNSGQRLSIQQTVSLTRVASRKAPARKASRSAVQRTAKVAGGRKA